MHAIIYANYKGGRYKLVSRTGPVWTKAVAVKGSGVGEALSSLGSLWV